MPQTCEMLARAFFSNIQQKFNILAFPGFVLCEWGCCRYLCAVLIQGIEALVLSFLAFSICSLTKNGNSRRNFIKKSTKLVYPSSYCPDGIGEHWSPRRRLFAGFSLPFALEPLERHLVRFCNVCKFILPDVYRFCICYDARFLPFSPPAAELWESPASWFRGEGGEQGGLSWGCKARPEICKDLGVSGIPGQSLWRRSAAGVFCGQI